MSAHGPSSRSLPSELQMHSTYTCHGYTIDVRCEFRLDEPPDHAPSDALPFGFVAVVQGRAAGIGPRRLAPVRLGNDDGHLSGDSINALRAGRAAGEIIVDDRLVDSGSADGRTHSRAVGRPKTFFADQRRAGAECRRFLRNSCAE
ncbi:hypothetical protein [Burkholderia catarinensis]|uniref:hypothetical protein n=1 Tax=Burkholderia catarinensis TaxID=1108140 RepID=UPI00267CCED4